MPGPLEYTQAELTQAIRACGVAPGDVVFSHVGLGFLGYPDQGRDEATAWRVALAAFAEALGPEGTLIIPTYTYSFCNHQPFDPGQTPSAVGAFTEHFRRLPGVVRSHDPIFSAAGLGPRAGEFLEDLPPDCFGADCLYHRLRLKGGKICNLGVGFRYATFVHHTEQSAGVPYRFRKLFTGEIRGDGPPRREGWIYYVRVLGSNSMPDLRRLEARARAEGLCRSAPVGRGQVTCVDCDDMFDLCTQGIAEDPWYLATGPARDPLELEAERVPPVPVAVSLPAGASPMAMVRALAPLPRHLVSEGYDAALATVAGQLPGTVHRYPTGEEAWTWLVPERWSCRGARLADLDGNTIFSYADNPLHVVSYSLPFAGRVSREELLEHLYVHPLLDQAIPYKFKYYDRDWGLCCSRRQREGLTDQAYLVEIDSDFAYGELKVFESVLPGRSRECFVLAAHLCHPGAANDGLSGVAAGVEVMRRLAQWEDRRYTYRLLVLPETVGSAAWLSHHEEAIPEMMGGLFLEMLGMENPHALQLSWDGDTRLDRLLAMALKERDPESWSGPFRQVVWNDETMFNAPGVRVPMLGLSRVRDCQGDPNRFFPAYHSHLDDADAVDEARLMDSVETTLHLISCLERDQYPVGRFKGEVFCSRHGIHVDGYRHPRQAARFFAIMFLLDGRLSIGQIAERVGLSFSETWEVVERFRAKGLVEYSHRPAGGEGA